MSAIFKPHIVGIGGTPRASSTSEMALRFTLDEIALLGASIDLLTGPSLILPMYLPEAPERSDNAIRITTALARAQGVVIASPGYHGAPSGLIKNVLDYVEDLREHACPYLEGRAVGLIACASGWQATGTTLITMRSIVHALRGWPTPLAVTINSSEKVFSADGTPLSANLGVQLRAVAAQVVDFARNRGPF